MAEDKDDLELDVKESSGDNSNMKMMLMMAGISLVVAVLAAVLTIALVGGDSKPEEGDGTEEVVPESTRKQAYYFDVRPPFVVNYHTKGRLRYLQVHVEIMVRGEETLEHVKQHLPLIKNNLVTLFSSADFAELQTYEGKEKLRERSLEEVQRVMVEQTGEPGIEAVLFTSFVIQ